MLTNILTQFVVIIAIIFITGLVMGILWGMYLEESKHYMKLKDIKIKDSFAKAKPAHWKMQERSWYYKMHHRFYVPIIVNSKGYLVDGYTSYLIAEKYNLKKVEVKKI